MKDFHFLGRLIRDRVTGFEGVVTSMSYDLYGCIQAIVTPVTDEKRSDLKDSRWFDTKRLTILNDQPVMEVPTFEFVPGAQEKPSGRYGE